MIPSLRSRFGTMLLAVLLFAGAVLTAILAASPREEGPPLAPDSVAADGTRALTEVLERIGADVVVDAEPPQGADTLLLLIDVLDETARGTLRERAEGGATVVVVDPRSELAPDPVGSAGIGFLETPIARSCELPALRQVERITPGDDITFEPPAGATGCFPRGAGSWLVAEPVGEGWVVVTGGPRWITNASLDETDNAALAVALLAPRSDAQVGIISPYMDLPEAMVQTPMDLIADWVWFVTAQVAVAGMLLIAWRVRRLGDPLVERPAVALPGSELVLALGGLHARRGDSAHAGRVIREAARREVARRTGLPPDASCAQTAEAAQRFNAPESAVATALATALPSNDAELVALARAAEEVRAALSPSSATRSPSTQAHVTTDQETAIAQAVETGGATRG